MQQETLPYHFPREVSVSVILVRTSWNKTPRYPWGSTLSNITELDHRI